MSGSWCLGAAGFQRWRMRSRPRRQPPSWSAKTALDPGSSLNMRRPCPSPWLPCFSPPYLIVRLAERSGTGSTTERADIRCNSDLSSSSFAWVALRICSKQLAQKLLWLIVPGTDTWAHSASRLSSTLQRPQFRRGPLDPGLTNVQVPSVVPIKLGVRPLIVHSSQGSDVRHVQPRLAGCLILFAALQPLHFRAPPLRFAARYPGFC